MSAPRAKAPVKGVEASAWLVASAPASLREEDDVLELEVELFALLLLVVADAVPEVAVPLVAVPEVAELAVLEPPVVLDGVEDADAEAALVALAPAVDPADRVAVVLEPAPGFDTEPCGSVPSLVPHPAIAIAVATVPGQRGARTIIPGCVARPGN
jgi:hypothetical protein